MAETNGGFPSKLGFSFGEMDFIGGVVVFAVLGNGFDWCGGGGVCCFGKWV